MPIATALQHPRRDQRKHARRKSELFLRYTDCLNGRTLALEIAADHHIVRAGFNAKTGHLRLFAKDGTLIHLNADHLCEVRSFEMIAANILAITGFYRASGVAAFAMAPYESLHVKKRSLGTVINGKKKAQSAP